MPPWAHGPALTHDASNCCCGLADDMGYYAYYNPGPCTCCNDPVKTVTLGGIVDQIGRPADPPGPPAPCSNPDFSQYQIQWSQLNGLAIPVYLTGDALCETLPDGRTHGFGTYYGEVTRTVNVKNFQIDSVTGLPCPDCFITVRVAVSIQCDSYYHPREGEVLEFSTYMQQVWVGSSYVASETDCPGGFFAGAGQAPGGFFSCADPEWDETEGDVAPDCAGCAWTRTNPGSVEIDGQYVRTVSVA